MMGQQWLVQYRGIADPDTGGAFSVKRYESEKVQGPRDTWEHSRIILKPLNPAFQPIEIQPSDADSVRVIAEFLEVLE
jgi:uncharacterized protein